MNEDLKQQIDALYVAIEDQKRLAKRVRRWLWWADLRLRLARWVTRAPRPRDTHDEHVWSSMRAIDDLVWVRTCTCGAYQRIDRTGRGPELTVVEPSAT